MRISFSSQTLPSKSSSVPLPTTSPGSHIHPDSNNASAAATSVKTETKTHKSEKTHKSDRSEKHHKHHKHRDKEKSHKRDKDKHREGREASDSPKLKIKPVVQSDAPNDNLADSFATASPTSGLKLKLRIGGPGGGSGNGGSLTPVKGGTPGAKEAGINALVAKHEVLDGSHGFPKKEHATGNGNHGELPSIGFMRSFSGKLLMVVYWLMLMSLQVQLFELRKKG